MSYYKRLIHDVLSHAQGRTLAIEVISKSLHGRNVSQWRGRLVRLSNKISKHTLKVLGIRSFCNQVRCLFPSFSIFSCMRELDLSFCNLLKIPDAFGNLHCLEKLCLRGNNFETLPSLKELSKLLHLNLQHCKRLKYLPELPSRTDWPLEKWRPVIHIFPSSLQDDEYGSGLNIFNCPELVERDCCTNNCFSWMMQIVRRYNYSFINHPYSYSLPSWVPLISSIIPGSEMPRWFDEQHLGMGNVINIERSHFMQLDDNWIGIACCVIFVVHKERRMLPPDMEQRKKEHPSLYIPVLFREDLVTDESDHLWLFYYTRSHFDVSNFDQLKVECRFRDLYDQDLDVEMCHHHLSSPMMCSSASEEKILVTVSLTISAEPFMTVELTPSLMTRSSREGTK
ncbi:hypothetical protein AAZX31_06G251100 [Glycine max]